MVIVNKISPTIVICPVTLFNDINNDSIITPVCENVRIDDGINITLTFVSALSSAEDTQLDLLILNLVCDLSYSDDDLLDDDVEVGDLTGSIYPVIFASGDEAENKWLAQTGAEDTSSDESPAIIPFNSKLVSIVFSNEKKNAKVDVEIYVAADGSGKSDSKIFTWPLRTIRTARKSNFTSDIIFTKGDKVGIYCKRINHTKIEQVVVILYLQLISTNNEEASENYSGDF